MVRILLLHIFLRFVLVATDSLELGLGWDLLSLWRMPRKQLLDVPGQADRYAVRGKTWPARLGVTGVSGHERSSQRSSSTHRERQPLWSKNTVRC